VTIKAQIRRDELSKETTYSFRVNSETFEVHIVPPKRNPTLYIQHNGTTVGTIIWEVEKNREFKYTVKTNTEPINITVWMDDYYFTRIIGIDTKSIGIDVNGVPVQNTILDIAPKFFFFLLIAFSFIGWYSIPSHPSVMSVLFKGNILEIIIPILIALILSIKYKIWTISAILIDIYILALEMFRVIQDTSNLSYVPAFIVQIYLLYKLCNIYKKERKLKKAGNTF